MSFPRSASLVALLLAAPAWATSVELSVVQKYALQGWELHLTDASTFADRLAKWKAAIAEAEGTVPPEEKAELAGQKEQLEMFLEWSRAEVLFDESFAKLTPEAVAAANKFVADFKTRYGKSPRYTWFRNGVENALSSLEKLAKFRTTYATVIEKGQAVVAQSAAIEEKIDDPAASVEELQKQISEHQAACAELTSYWSDRGNSQNPQQLKNSGVPLDFAKRLLAFSEDKHCLKSTKTIYTTRNYWQELRVRLPATPENTSCVIECNSPFANQLLASSKLPVKDVFLMAHPTRFVFLTKKVDGNRTLARGEAVLIAALNTTWSKATILAIDGERIELPYDYLSKTPIKGAALFSVKPTDLEVYGTYHDGTRGLVCGPGDEDVSNTPPEALYFTKVMDPEDPAYVKFDARLDKFWSCFNGTMSKLDPDHRAWSYDQETFNVRTGETIKVESYAEVLKRKACKTCDCGGVQKARRELSRKVCAPFRKAELERLQAVFDKVRVSLGQ